MKKSYFVSVILFLGVIAGAIITAGSEIGMFFDPASLVMVILIPTLFSLATNSLGEMGSYFACGFQESPDVKTLKKGIVFFKALTKYLIFAGFVSVMVGTITILSYLGAIENTGAGAALALISLLYALCLVLAVALPFRIGLEKKLAGIEG